MKIRKLKNQTHKNFGNHSRIVDGVYVTPKDAGGRSVGSKQIHPENYKSGRSDFRSRAEKRNADDIRLNNIN